MTQPADRPGSRDLWVVLETLHAVTYFDLGCRAAFQEAGLRGFWAGYFAGRAAPLGAVGAGPVTAAFYNFHPAMVSKALPACWESVAPLTLCRVRAIAAGEALSEACSVGARSDLLAELPLLRRAVAGCDVAGRVMAAPNRALWPTISVALGAGGLAEVWQACTTLREHRGDGHVAALLTHGIEGIDAHLLAVGTKGVPAEVLRDNRGWSEDDWERATSKLASRGLLHTDGRATDAGRTLHASIEEQTDRLAGSPYADLSDVAIADLYGALSACAREVVASGILPFPNPMGLPQTGWR